VVLKYVWLKFAQVLFTSQAGHKQDGCQFELTLNTGPGLPKTRHAVSAGVRAIRTILTPVNTHTTCSSLAHRPMLKSACDNSLRGIAVKAGIVATLQPVVPRGLAYISHGGSTVHVYAAHGAVFVSRDNHFHIGRAFPSQLCTIDMMHLQTISSLLSIQQLVATVLLPKMFVASDTENIIVGGWSLGSLVARYSVLQLEACSAGPRGVFIMDERRLPPDTTIQDSVAQGYVDQGPETRRLERAGQQIAARSFTNIDFGEAPKWRVSAPSSSFTCPLRAADREFVLDDSEVGMRSTLYSKTGDVYHLSDTTHLTIGADHFWDMGRRLRLAQSNFRMSA